MGDRANQNKKEAESPLASTPLRARTEARTIQPFNSSVGDEEYFLQQGQGNLSISHSEIIQQSESENEVLPGYDQSQNQAGRRLDFENTSGMSTGLSTESMQMIAILSNKFQEAFKRTERENLAAFNKMKQECANQALATRNVVNEVKEQPDQKLN